MVTRYFTFSRINPGTKDYDLLASVAERFDVFVAYKTSRQLAKFRQVVIYRLVGFLVLRGPPTVAGVIGKLLPNFLVTKLHGCYHKAVRNFNSFDGTLGVTPAFYLNVHPYDSVKMKLFV